MLAQARCTLQIRGEETNLLCFEFRRYSKVKNGNKLTLTKTMNPSQFQGIPETMVTMYNQQEKNPLLFLNFEGE